MTITQPQVGTRFMRSDSRPYTSADGTKGVHETVVLNEVTATDMVGFTYVTTALLSESGRPAWAGGLGGGRMAWFGWDAAVARGDVEVV